MSIITSWMAFVAKLNHTALIRSSKIFSKRKIWLPRLTKGEQSNVVYKLSSSKIGLPWKYVGLGLNIQVWRYLKLFFFINHIVISSWILSNFSWVWEFFIKFYVLSKVVLVLPDCQRSWKAHFRHLSCSVFSFTENTDLHTSDSFHAFLKFLNIKVNGPSDATVVSQKTTIPKGSRLTLQVQSVAVLHQ